MPTMESLFATLKQDAVSMERYHDPVVGSDLYIYERTTYERLEREVGRGQNFISPFSREIMFKAPFPFAMKDFSALCNVDKNSIDLLYKLAVCPITKELMRDPIKVHLTYADREGAASHYFLVCERSALRGHLPPQIQIIKQVEWGDLAAIMNDHRVRPRLETYHQSVSIGLEDLDIEEEPQQQRGQAAAGRVNSMSWEIGLSTLLDAYQATEVAAARAAAPPPGQPGHYRGGMFPRQAPRAEEPAPRDDHYRPPAPGNAG